MKIILGTKLYAYEKELKPRDKTRYKESECWYLFIKDANGRNDPDKKIVVVK
jgi:hypothetical protein